MTSITIYSPTGGVVYEVPITKDARVFRQLGGDYYVELSFSVDKILDLPKGSYIEILDPTTDPTTESEEKYALKRDATPEPISGVNGYKYVLKFYSRQHDMEACQIKWLAGGSQELSFRVTTSLRGFAQLIANNMNAYLGTTDWSFDEELDDTDMREQAFEGVSCWDAINSIANAFGVEWWVDHGDQLTIRFGKCENEGVETDIREGEIVNRFPAPKRGDDSNYGTRFYIFGGTQNVPESYRSNNTASGGTTFHIAEKRIQLCKIYGVDDKVSKEYYPYFDAVDVPKGEIVEKTIILNEVFPKIKTTIREGDILTQDENIIEGEEKQPVYYIKVSKKPTVLSTLGITFTSGALSGRSFGAAYTTQVGWPYIKVLHTTENSGGASLIAVPNANLAPKVGDKYILTGVELEPDRITAAERELWNKGTELALKYANDTNVYDCPVNPVYCSEKKVNLALGDKVILKGAHFGEKGRYSRIQGYEKKLYNPYIATYNIGDNSVYSRTAKVIKDIQLPVAEAVASTERKNNSLYAHISSMQSDTQLARTIQRLNDIEGYDTDTAESVSIPGAKKYADKVAGEAYDNAKELADGVLGEKTDAAGKLTVYGTRNYIDKIFSPIIKGDKSLIGLLFFGGRNVSTDIYVPKPLVLFDPSLDFLARYDVQKEDKVLNPPNYESAYYVKITTSNYANYIGAVISIEVDVTSDEFTNAFGYALHAGDWLVASPYGWKKINGSDVGGSNGVDFEEVKNWVETKLQSYAKMSTEQPIQDSILIYDSDNQIKSSDVQISTTVQDIENGENSKIPTCGQVLGYVDDALSYKQETLINGENIKTVFGQSVLGGGDVLGEFSLEIQNTGTYRVESIANARIVRNGVTTPIDIDVETHIGNGPSVYVTLSQSGELQVRGTIGGVYLSYLANGTIQDDFIPSTIARIADIKQSDWSEGDSSSKAYINNRTHYFQPYSAYRDLSTYSTSVGENFGSLGEYFSLGGYVYKSSDIVGQEFNCAPYGPSVIVSVVVEAPNGYDQFFLKFVDGALTTGISIPFYPIGNVKPIDEVYIPNGVARTKDLNVRNVCIVDTEDEIDDTISFATTEYVDTAIATAITTTLNTPV